MVLKTFDVSNNNPIVAVPLTPEAFADFGDIISADHQIGTKQQSSANYGTAIKVHKVAAVNNYYANAPSGKLATANWNIFRCSPPQHLITKEESHRVYLSKVLERHPFSTQTFMPMGAHKSNQAAYIVICALTDPNTKDSLPDPNTIQAFVCKGNQAVTYRQGTWHAPMVSLVKSLDFGVLIHENGVADEDCQECYFDPGYKIIFPAERTASRESKF